MPTKLVLADYIKKCQQVHNHKYDYSLAVLNGAKNDITIICPEHGQFKQAAYDHSKGHGCSQCALSRNAQSIKMNFSTFIEKANIIHKNKYAYHQENYPEFSYQLMIIVCPIHSNFRQRRDVHLNGHGCQACAKNKQLTVDDVINRSKLIHGDKYQYYLCNLDNSFLVISCYKHGLFQQRINDHISGHGCSKCAFEINSNKKKFTTVQFIDKANVVHNNLYDYSLTYYLGFNKNLKITCKKHGEFLQRAENHLNGHGCPTCCHTVSKPETAWLNFLNIAPQNRQVKLVIDNKKYKVDGFDPSTNTIYEFNGDYFHGNPQIFRSNDLNKTVKKTFGELYQKTLQKQYNFLRAGFNVISIWESDFNKQSNNIVSYT